MQVTVRDFASETLNTPLDLPQFQQNWVNYSLKGSDLSLSTVCYLGGVYYIELVSAVRGAD